jgi:SAM-dependent methyltransferase
VNIDKNDLYEDYLLHDKNHLKNLPIKCRTKHLQDHWYKSLSGIPAYNVYNDPYYICDIWLCWKPYSRKGLLALKNPKSMINKSVVDFINSPKKILDLGCGFGYTTAGLKEFFPEASVVGTNVKESYQFEIARKTGTERGFSITDNIESVGLVDVVFASEYFEHIVNPIEHAYNLINKTKPKIFIIANGFSGIAIGHFNEYYHKGKKYNPNEMSKMFSKFLAHMGYKKIKTKIWNNRPSLLVK